MKLMKPIEFYATARKMSAPNLKKSCTPNLCIAVGISESGKSAGNVGTNLELLGSPAKTPAKRNTPGRSSIGEVSSRSAGGLGDGHLSDEEASVVILRDNFAEALQKRIHYLRATKKKQLLARLHWMVARARVLTLLRQVEMESMFPSAF